MNIRCNTAQLQVLLPLCHLKTTRKASFFDQHGTRKRFAVFREAEQKTAAAALLFSLQNSLVYDIIISIIKTEVV